jgi:hypothetical protein
VHKRTLYYSPKWRDLSTEFIEIVDRCGEEAGDSGIAPADIWRQTCPLQGGRKGNFVKNKKLFSGVARLCATFLLCGGTGEREEGNGTEEK